METNIGIHFNPLTTEQLKEAAPTVFTEKPKTDLSDRYAFIPTSDVVEFMEQNGWFPIEAKQVKTRKDENSGFQRHMIRFRHPELSFNQVNDDRNFVDILLTNSHNGTSSFTFQLGIFRLVCSNGLVVRTADFGSVRVRHLLKGSEAEFETMFQEALNTLVNQIPKTITSIQDMQDTELNENQIQELALKAVTARFENKTENVDLKAIVDQVVEAKRTQDMGNNVWVVFNRLQESLVNGKYFYTNTKTRKTRKARPVNNIAKSSKLNTELFNLAYEMVEA